MIRLKSLPLGYMGMEVPRHTQETLENYLLRGLSPGGFVSAMLAHDYERAISVADTGNRQMFWAIAMWINECTPPASRGSYAAIEQWRDDLGGRRTEFVKSIEQDYIWKKLKEKDCA